MASPTQQQKPVFRLGLWWLLFAVASFALSLFFQAFREFTVTPTQQTFISLVASVVFVVCLTLILVYDGYVKERFKGNVIQPFAPFDWLIARQYGMLPDGGDADAPVH